VRTTTPSCAFTTPAAIVALAAIFSGTACAQAQDVIDRPVTIYVAGTAGGGIDLYARMLARYLGR
jgi:tripartite-type tricarboxylate transporter receptor subunit TctC